MEAAMDVLHHDELPEDFAARLVEGCADAIVYANAAGVIRFWNEGATRIFGYAAGEALRRELADLKAETSKAGI
jgi:PAS domain S-box-containing protein